MNLKTAKALRGLVKKLVNDGVINEPWTRYGHVDHTKKVPGFVLDKDGNKKMGEQEITRHTRVIDPNCPRGIYRRMKKSGPLSVLSGAA